MTSLPFTLRKAVSRYLDCQFSSSSLAHTFHLQSPWRIDSPQEAANLLCMFICFTVPFNASSFALSLDASHSLRLKSGALIAVPIPEKYAAAGEKIQAAVEQALKEGTPGVMGRDVTPVLLRRVVELTGGLALENSKTYFISLFSSFILPIFILIPQIDIALIENTALIGKYTVSLSGNNSLYACYLMQVGKLPSSTQIWFEDVKDSKRPLT